MRFVAAIETAPKDGTHLLLWYPEYHRKVWVGHYYSTETYEHGKLKRKSEGWHNGADTFSLVKECQPTHWMALPLPPNIQGERRKAAAADVRFVSEPNGCLPFAPPCGLDSGWQSLWQ